MDWLSRWICDNNHFIYVTFSYMQIKHNLIYMTVFISFFIIYTQTNFWNTYRFPLISQLCLDNLIVNWKYPNLKMCFMHITYWKSWLKKDIILRVWLSTLYHHVPECPPLCIINPERDHSSNLNMDQILLNFYWMYIVLGPS
jgi:hypothetical protein